jgi:ElaB/YqjD/DUF883 family membrane-anchored ribosome-binding protein
MIFATIDVVKNWDLPTFMALGSSQREAIIKALNQDTEKLLSESDISPQDAAKLRREMAECNKIFKDLSDQAGKEGHAAKSPSRQMIEQIDQLRQILEGLEQQLANRQRDSVPRDMDMLQNLVHQHKVCS